MAIAGTKVRIPGQEERSFANFDMSVEQVRASFQGAIDLSNMNVAESREGAWKVLTFTPRTGTKGATLAGTKVRIPGQEERSFANFDMSVEQVRASFQGAIDLSNMNVAETREGNWKVLTFTPRTGTKGC